MPWLTFFADIVRRGKPAPANHSIFVQKRKTEKPEKLSKNEAFVFRSDIIRLPVTNVH